MRIKKNINYGITNDPIPNSPNKHNENQSEAKGELVMRSWELIMVIELSGM